MKKCPYCEKTNFIPHVVFIHTENYGSGFHRFRCKHCNKVVSGRFERIATVSHIERSTEKMGDWG